MSWEGPIKIGEIASNDLRPPESQGVYVVSRSNWVEQPTKESSVIYVGQAGILRRRIGELVAALLGFAPSSERRYLHGKGRRIFNETCHAKIAESAELFVGWNPIKNGECIDYEEAKLFHALHGSGELIFKKIPRCNKPRHRHTPFEPIPIIDSKSSH